MGPWTDLGGEGPENRGRKRGDIGPKESSPEVGVMVTWLRWKQE